MSAADQSVANEVEARVRARIDELRPLVEEYRKLEQILELLSSSASAVAQQPQARVRGGRAGSSGRAEQALALVRERPGITVQQLAGEMGIGPTYLYKLLPALASNGQIRKAGRGYEPVD